MTRHRHHQPRPEIVFGTEEANPGEIVSDPAEIVFTPEESIAGLEGVAPASPRDPVRPPATNPNPTTTDRVVQDALAAGPVASDTVGALANVPAAPTPAPTIEGGGGVRLPLPPTPEVNAPRVPILPGIAGLIAAGAGYYQGMNTLRTAQNQDQRVNGVLQTAGAIESGVGAGLSFGGEALAPATAAAGLAAAAAEGAQGVYNLYRSFTAHDRPGASADDVEQQRVDGANQVLHAWLASLTNPAAANPALAAAAQGGVTGGQMIVNHTDAYARQTGMYGADPYAQSASRAVNTQAVRNASGSDAAANAGARTFTSVHNALYDVTGNETVSTIGGGVVGGARAIGGGIVNSGHAAAREAGDLASRGYHFVGSLMPW